MALQQTQGLIAEIEKAGIPAYQPRQKRRSQCTLSALRALVAGTQGSGTQR
jgi:hypothetical protein